MHAPRRHGPPRGLPAHPRSMSIPSPTQFVGEGARAFGRAGEGPPSKPFHPPCVPQSYRRPPRRPSVPAAGSGGCPLTVPPPSPAARSMRTALLLPAALLLLSAAPLAAQRPAAPPTGRALLAEAERLEKREDEGAKALVERALPLLTAPADRPLRLRALGMQCWARRARWSRTRSSRWPRAAWPRRSAPAMPASRANLRICRGYGHETRRAHERSRRGLRGRRGRGTPAARRPAAGRGAHAARRAALLPRRHGRGARRPHRVARAVRAPGGGGPAAPHAQRHRQPVRRPPRGRVRQGHRVLPPGAGQQPGRRQPGGHQHRVLQPGHHARHQGRCRRRAPLLPPLAGDRAPAGRRGGGRLRGARHRQRPGARWAAPPRRCPGWTPRSRTTCGSGTWTASRAARLSRGVALRALGRPAEALAELETARTHFDSDRQRALPGKAARRAGAGPGRHRRAGAARTTRAASRCACRRRSRSSSSRSTPRGCACSSTRRRRRRRTCALVRENRLRGQALAAGARVRRLQTVVLVLTAGIMAVLVVLVVRHVSSERQLRTMAMTDELTRLPNRRHLLAVAHAPAGRGAARRHAVQRPGAGRGPLQAHQRHLRPRGGRHGAAARGAGLPRRPAPRRRTSAARAARSSSSSFRTPTRRRPWRWPSGCARPWSAWTGATWTPPCA